MNFIHFSAEITSVGDRTSEGTYNLHDDSFSLSLNGWNQSYVSCQPEHMMYVLFLQKIVGRAPVEELFWCPSVNS